MKGVHQYCHGKQRILSGIWLMWIAHTSRVALIFASGTCEVSLGRAVLVCVARFWQQRGCRGGPCEKLADASSMSNRAMTSWLQDRHATGQGQAGLWQWWHLWIMSLGRENNLKQKRGLRTSPSTYVFNCKIFKTKTPLFAIMMMDLRK